MTDPWMSAVNRMCNSISSLFTLRFGHSPFCFSFTQGWWNKYQLKTGVNVTDSPHSPEIAILELKCEINNIKLFSACNIPSSSNEYLQISNISKWDIIEEIHRILKYFLFICLFFLFFSSSLKEEACIYSLRKIFEKEQPKHLNGYK